MNRKRIVVICPGRGSYTRETHGYLKTYGHSSSKKIKYMDDERLNAGLPSLTEIDSKIFKSSIHMKGEHASTLIYACSLIDYYSIDQSKFEIVAIQVIQWGGIQRCHFLNHCIIRRHIA